MNDDIRKVADRAITSLASHDTGLAEHYRGMLTRITEADAAILRNANHELDRQNRELQEQCDNLKEALAESLRLMEAIKEDEGPALSAGYRQRIDAFITHHRYPAWGCGTNLNGAS